MEKNYHLHKLTKIKKKNCKAIVDSENCINAISFKIIEKIGLKAEPHPNPYRVS